MARKRMISPEIWESQSFGELSILAKVLFIGMISQADDDGKGILSAQLLKSRILPFDELRIADVDKALNEIGHNVSVAPGADTDKALNERGHKLSVVFYEVDGKHYYLFENWRKWQTINRPIPSKLPNPPCADGEGGGVHSREVFSDNSVSTHTQNSEYSRAIEVVIEDKLYTHTESAREGKSDLQVFCERYGISIDTCSPLIAEMNFQLLTQSFETSKQFLQVRRCARFLSWVVKNYQSIIQGKYEDEDKLTTSARQSAHERGTDILKTLYEENIGGNKDDPT